MDLLGGYFLPSKFQKAEQTFGFWVTSYVVGASSQAVIFVLLGALINALSKIYGVLGGIAAIYFQSTIKRWWKQLC